MITSLQNSTIAMSPCTKPLPIYVGMLREGTPGFESFDMQSAHRQSAKNGLFALPAKQTAIVTGLDSGFNCSKAAWSSGMILA